jgi:hypothetical protein
MPINLTVNLNNKSRTFTYGLIMMVLCISQMLYIIRIDICQIAVVKFHTPDITAAALELYHDIPHEDCRCSAIPTKDCLSTVHFKIIRILPLILFIVEISFIREHFILSGDRSYFIINVYWIASIFVFFGIVIIIYRSSFYYGLSSLFLCIIGSLLFCYFFYYTRPEH